MHLPELELQFLYARLAWGIVLATLLVTLWPRRMALSRVAVAVIALGMLALQALPGEASPAYWLGLAFQWPSGLLMGLCLARLYLAANGEPHRAVIPPAFAMLIAATGLILYLDAIGLIALGLYYWGFGPYAAPVLALLLMLASAVAMVRNTMRPLAFSALLALLGFTLLRLPTGNIWDALLDPLLWGCALIALARSGRQRWIGKRQAAIALPEHACGHH